MELFLVTFFCLVFKMFPCQDKIKTKAQNNCSLYSNILELQILKDRTFICTVVIFLDPRYNHFLDVPAQDTAAQLLL